MGTLPIERDEILPLLTNEDGTFLDQEGSFWDFKVSWPEVYSDNYFYGLCRLICAFSNTQGGLIVFGVDDKSRLPSNRRVKPNVDRLEQAFEQLTGTIPDLQCRTYNLDGGAMIDILLVKQLRGHGARPLRFREDAGSYQANSIFIRKGSQVREATSNDIAALYLSNDDEIGPPPQGQLPPSPATVREFIGRMDAIDRIFSWLTTEDEPRAFLFGKGGSGKSTIAYQVYKSIKLNSQKFKMGNGHLERLIFISAKSNYLDADELRSKHFVGNDFSNEKELYQAILTLGDASIDERFFNDIERLKVSIKDFFDSTSCFVVIDDIDTLSTANEETGMDFLLGALWRSRKTSKILYTLRNRPTQSLSSSLEIPGLSGKEFERFVTVCASQFGVPSPNSSARDNLILPTSEGRPLVIESIIALRRTTGNYPDAVKLFESEAGNDVRDYVFRREWDALDQTDRGREILTILALFNGSIAVEDIVTISKMDGSKVRDALAAVQEIFLIVDNSVEETYYSIGGLTRSFVLEKAEKLDLFARIKARVDNFKNTFYANSPELNTLKNQFYRASAAHKNGESRYLTALLQDLDREESPKLAEDPRFLCLRASVRLTRDLTDVSRARADFETAMDFKHSPDPDEINLWLRAEKAGDSGERMTSEILKRVMLSRGYRPDFKAKVKFDRACYLYTAGKSESFTDPHRASDFFQEALKLHMEAFRVVIHEDSFFTSKSEEYTKNTGFTLGNHLKKSREPDDFLSIVADISQSGDVYADPLVEPLQSFMLFAILARETRKSILQRRLGKFQSLVGKLAKRDVWLSKDSVSSLEDFSRQIKKHYEAIYSQQ
jgi:Putative DNA-binding domain/NB-ARC domain